MLAFMLAIVFSVRVQAANLPGLTVIGVAPDGTRNTHYSLPLAGGGGQDLPCADPSRRGCRPTTPLIRTGIRLDDGIPGGEILAVGFHRSYMPVVAKGCVGFEDVVAGKSLHDSCAADVLPVGGFDSDKNYYVSVVPRSAAWPQHHRRCSVCAGGRRNCLCQRTSNPHRPDHHVSSLKTITRSTMRLMCPRRTRLSMAAT